MVLAVTYSELILKYVDGIIALRYLHVKRKLFQIKE